MRKSKSDGKDMLKYVAFHEAGHAVAYCYFFNGPRFKHVTIKPKGSALGHVLGRPSIWRPDEDTGVRFFVRLRDRIIRTLAGPEAERKVRGRYNQRGASDDWKSVADLVFHMAGSERQVNALMRYFDVVTEEFIEFRWHKIEAVASALLERTTLSYKEVEQILCPGLDQIPEIVTIASSIE
mgnify:CR=1 FL=1